MTVEITQFFFPPTTFFPPIPKKAMCANVCDRERNGRREARGEIDRMHSTL